MHLITLTLISEIISLSSQNTFQVTEVLLTPFLKQVMAQRMEEQKILTQYAPTHHYWIPVIQNLFQFSVKREHCSFQKDPYSLT